MKIVPAILFKLLWTGFLLLTSLYCLLTFLPYTYAALIKAPAYDWMPWFVGYPRMSSISPITGPIMAFRLHYCRALGKRFFLCLRSKWGIRTRNGRT